MVSFTLSLVGAKRKRADGKEKEVKHDELQNGPSFAKKARTSGGDGSGKPAPLRSILKTSHSVQFANPERAAKTKGMGKGKRTDPVVVDDDWSMESGGDDDEDSDVEESKRSRRRRAKTSRRKDSGSGKEEKKAKASVRVEANLEIKKSAQAYVNKLKQTAGNVVPTGHYSINTFTKNGKKVVTLQFHIDETQAPKMCDLFDGIIVLQMRTDPARFKYGHNQTTSGASKGSRFYTMVDLESSTVTHQVFLMPKDPKHPMYLALQFDASRDTDATMKTWAPDAAQWESWTKVCASLCSGLDGKMAMKKNLVSSEDIVKVFPWHFERMYDMETTVRTQVMNEMAVGGKHKSLIPIGFHERLRTLTARVRDQWAKVAKAATTTAGGQSSSSSSSSSPSSSSSSSNLMDTLVQAAAPGPVV